MDRLFFARWKLIRWTTFPADQITLRIRLGQYGSLAIAAKVRFKPYQTFTAAIARPLEVGIIRDGQPYGFWRPQAKRLEQGDIVMAISPSVP